MPAPGPTQIDSWERAEANAAAWMRWWGFTDATVTPSGSDGGVDVRGTSALAQVKTEAHQVGRPALQRLVGARPRHGRHALLFFTGFGFSDPAVAYADEWDIALFKYALDGSMTPLNPAARLLLRDVEQRESAARRADEERLRAHRAAEEGRLRAQQAADEDRHRTQLAAEEDRRRTRPAAGETTRRPAATDAPRVAEQHAQRRAREAARRAQARRRAPGREASTSGLFSGPPNGVPTRPEQPRRRRTSPEVEARLAEETEVRTARKRAAIRRGGEPPQRRRVGPWVLTTLLSFALAVYAVVRAVAEAPGWPVVLGLAVVLFLVSCVGGGTAVEHNQVVDELSGKESGTS